MAETTTAKPGAKTPGRRNTDQLNLRVPRETRAVLDAILERDGVPYTAQIIRAVRLWGEHQGIEVSHDLRHDARKGTR
jgi:hypothetical protein